MSRQIRFLVLLGAAFLVAAGFTAACSSNNNSRSTAAATSGGGEPQFPASNAATTIPVVDSHAHGATMSNPVLTEKALAFHDAMRKLWEDHITWTRLFIVSASAGLPDQAATTARLLQNQADIGDAIKQFYGDAAGEQLTALLRDHILIAADLLADARAGNQPKVTADSAKWSANANQIAAFLHSANPQHWPISEAQQMMKDHLGLTLDEAVARLQGRYEDDISAYDKVHLEILQMADMLSSGIIAQFPDKFQ